MGQVHTSGPKQPVAEQDSEADMKAIKEALSNKWKEYEWHHPPDLTAVNEPCFPLKSRCRVLKVSNFGALEDEEGKTITFNEGLKPDEHVVKLVCMSDTHGDAKYWLNNGLIPDGDIFMFSGDMTGKGTRADVTSFIEFLKQLPHKHKVVIAGNHGL